jgi:hypothetical protein
MDDAGRCQAPPRWHADVRAGNAGPTWLGPAWNPRKPARFRYAAIVFLNNRYTLKRWDDDHRDWYDALPEGASMGAQDLRVYGALLREGRPDLVAPDED